MVFFDLLRTKTPTRQASTSHPFFWNKGVSSVTSVGERHGRIRGDAALPRGTGRSGRVNGALVGAIVEGEMDGVLMPLHGASQISFHEPHGSACFLIAFFFSPPPDPAHSGFLLQGRCFLSFPRQSV